MKNSISLIIVSSKSAKVVGMVKIDDLIGGRTWGLLSELCTTYIKLSSSLFTTDFARALSSSMCLFGCSFPLTHGCGSWLVNTCVFFFCSQSLRPFYIATAMTYGTKPNVFVPSPETYVKNALRTLELSTRNTGYWNHEIQVLPPTYSTYLNKHLGVTCSQTCWRNRTSAKRKKRFNEFNHPTPLR